MRSKTRAWVVWLLPCFIGAGYALGALLGISLTSDALSQEGSAGDVAGAAGALVVGVCLVLGCILSAFTIVAARLRRRGRPDRIALRVGLSVAAGGVIGALAAGTGIMTTATVWLLLLAGPPLLSWPWGLVPDS